MGIDLVPFKTCTYDCVYCQLGRTTHKTVEREEYVRIEAVLAELERKLAIGNVPDYITLAGSGEPTLNRGIGRLLTAIKEITDIPVAVITNGSLLWMDDVQSELMAADLVLPSLDAGDAEMFERINRPDPAITFDRMVEGLATFTKRFHGETRLEVMLLAGLTDRPAEVTKIAALTRRVAPARTELNTANRPPAEGFVRPVPPDRLVLLMPLFEGEVDVVCDFTGDEKRPTAGGDPADADILALLTRRPCTADDIAAGLHLHTLDVLKRLDTLLAKGRIRLLTSDGGTFYGPRDSNAARHP